MKLFEQVIEQREEVFGGSYFVTYIPSPHNSTIINSEHIADSVYQLQIKPMLNPGDVLRITIEKVEG